MKLQYIETDTEKRLKSEKNKARINDWKVKKQ